MIHIRVTTPFSRATLFGVGVQPVNPYFHAVVAIVVMAACMLFAPDVLAQDVPAEWTGPWCRVIKMLTGPIAIGLLVAATVVAGLLFAIGESGSTASRSAGLVLGGTLAVSAPALVKFIFGVSALGC